MAVHGRATITIGGKRFNSKEGATLKMGGEEGEPVMGDGGFAGMQYSNTAGELNVTFIATEDVSLKDIAAIKEANASFDSDNGKSWVTDNLSCGPQPEFGKDGIECTFYGEFTEV